MPAARDFDEIWQHIEEVDPAAAARVGEAILSSIEGLAIHPRRGRVGRVPGTRELAMPPLPYLIVYEADDRRVAVLRIIHGAMLWPSAPMDE
ncbi:MAG: type II toxin-antitoxin system RelE/ParE family toxin [Methylocella sp.]